MTQAKSYEKQIPNYPYLRVDIVESLVPLARSAGVSDVALSTRGFVSAYGLSLGSPRLLGVDPQTGQTWYMIRAKALSRFESHARRQGESMWTNAGQPTRRHLAMIMWAYTPCPHEFATWYARYTNG